MSTEMNENLTKIALPSEIFKPQEYITRDGELDGLRVELGGQVFETDEEIPWSFVISNTGKGILVHGKLKMSLHTQCARCLEDARLPLEVDVSSYYVLKPEDAEDDEQDVKVLPVDRTIELLDDIEAAVMMELPVKPLCSTDCKGLCPKCGANLNERECDCEDDELKLGENNPFGALKDYDFN